MILLAALLCNYRPGFCLIDIGTEGSWNPSDSITDRNGNKISVTPTVDIGVGQTATILSDEALGRQIMFTSSFSIPQDVITQIGSSSGSEGAQELTWTINWRTVTGSSYTCPLGPCYLTNTVIDTLTLPSFDGTTQQYQFGYDVDTGSGSNGQMTLILPPTAPATCTKLSLAASCPRFTYTYGHGRTYPGWVGSDILTQKQRIWQEDQTGQSRTETSSYTYAGTNDSTIVTNPDGGMVTYNYYTLTPSVPANDWQEGLVTKIVQPDHSTVEQIWNQNFPYPHSSEQYGPGNPYVQTEFHSVSNGSSPTLMNVRNYTYDKNGNATQIDEYDWVSYASPPTLSGSAKRTTKVTPTVMVGTASATEDLSVDYWNPGSNPTTPGAPLLQHLTQRKEVDDLSPSLRAQARPPSFPMTPRVTWSTGTTGIPPRQSCRAWGALSTGNSSHRHFVYDSYGNVTDATDAIGTTTHYGYDSTSCISSITEGYGTSFARSTSRVCDPNTGLEIQRTDYNGMTRSQGYDPLGRLTSVQYTAASQLLKSTKTFYADGTRRVTTCTDLNTPGDLAMIQVTAYDQLGRVNVTGQSETANPNAPTCKDTAPQGILTDTRYQTGTGASYKLESNPYRTTSDATMGWTLTTFDTLGRPQNVTSYSGGTPPVPWSGSTPPSTGAVMTSYSSDNQTVMDQAGVTRTLQTDGLGAAPAGDRSGLGGHELPLRRAGRSNFRRADGAVEPDFFLRFARAPSLGH